MSTETPSAAVPFQGGAVVTLAAVARAAGVSTMTVSRALRNAPGTSATTRAKLQELAERMGYVPNPLVTAYQTQVRRGRLPHAGLTLGWLNDHAEEGHWQRHPFSRGRWVGAAKRAAELGYRLEEIWNEGVTGKALEEDARRLHRQTVARGIPGLLIPYGRFASLADVVWPELAVIAGVGGVAKKGAGHLHPRYHSVLPDYFHYVKEAFDRLVAHGCERIGFHLPGYLDRMSEQAMQAAFLDSQRRFCTSKAKRVPLLLADIEIGKPHPAEFEAWFERYRPDGLICSKNETVGWLQGLKVLVPQEVQVVHLWLAEDVQGWAGIDPGQERLGATMVEWLVALLQRNERSAPSHPLRILVPGEWKEGWTVRSD